MWKVSGSKPSLCTFRVRNVHLRPLAPMASKRKYDNAFTDNKVWVPFDRDWLAQTATVMYTMIASCTLKIKPQDNVYQIAHYDSSGDACVYDEVIPWEQWEFGWWERRKNGNGMQSQTWDVCYFRRWCGKVIEAESITVCSESHGLNPDESRELVRYPPIEPQMST